MKSNISGLLTGFLLLISSLLNYNTEEIDTRFLEVKELPILNDDDIFDPSSIAGVVKVVGSIATILEKGDKLIGNADDLLTKGSDIFGRVFGNSKPDQADYSNNFNKLYIYHKDIQTKLDLLRQDTETILAVAAAHQTEIINRLTNIEKSIVGTALNGPYSTIQGTISKVKAKGTLDSWKDQEDAYRTALIEILKHEFRPQHLLEIPSYVNFYLMSEDTRNLKTDFKGTAKKTLKPFIDTYISNLNEAYYTREKLFFEDFRLLMYDIGVFQGEIRKLNGKNIRILKGTNIWDIEDFSKTKVTVDINKLDPASDKKLKKGGQYKRVIKAKEGLMDISQSRDVFYSIKVAAEEYYKDMGFDRVVN